MMQANLTSEMFSLNSVCVRFNYFDPNNPAAGDEREISVLMRQKFVQILTISTQHVPPLAVKAEDGMFRWLA